MAYVFVINYTIPIKRVATSMTNYDLPSLRGMGETFSFSYIIRMSSTFADFVFSLHSNLSKNSPGKSVRKMRKIMKKN